MKSCFSLSSLVVFALIGCVSCQTLSSLITTQKFTVPGANIANVDYEWGPYVRQLPNGNIKIAWIDAARTKITVHHLNANLAQVIPPTVITGFNKLSAFEVHPDGRSVVLTSNSTGCDGTCVLGRNCTVCLNLFLIQLSATGAISNKILVDDRYFKQDGKFSSANIAIGNWQGQGESYAIMRAVRGTEQSNLCKSSASNAGHQWHEVWIYNASTMEVKSSGCNKFPCGHSVGLKQIAFHPTAKTFGATCIGDFNGGPSQIGFRFARDSENWNAKTIFNSWTAYPNFVNPGNPTELVPSGPDSFLVASQAPKLLPTDLQDFLVARVHVNGTVLGGPWWYAPMAGVVNPHLAKYGNNYLIGWQTVIGNYLSVIRADGTVVKAPELISPVTKFSMSPRWITLADGSVMWIRFFNATTLEIAKIKLATGISSRNVEEESPEVETTESAQVKNVVPLSPEQTVHVEESSQVESTAVPEAEEVKVEIVEEKNDALSNPVFAAVVTCGVAMMVAVGVLVGVLVVRRRRAASSEKIISSAGQLQQV